MDVIDTVQEQSVRDIETVLRVRGVGCERCDIVSVTLPEGVDTIDDDAFKSCTGLTDFHFPNTVTHLPNTFCVTLPNIE